MDERQDAALELYDLGVLSEYECHLVQSCRCQHLGQDARVEPIIDGKEHQRVACWLRQRTHPRGERRSQLGAQRDGLADACRRRTEACRPGQRQERQRVTPRRSGQPLGALGVDGLAGLYGQELLDRLRLQAAHLQASIDLDADQGVLAGGQHDPNRIVGQASADEPESLLRRGVQPLEIVHDREDRIVGGRLGQQCHRTAEHRQWLQRGLRRHRQADRLRECGLLPRWQARQVCEERAQEIVQPRERQRGVRFRAPDERHRMVGGFLGQGPAQLALADAGLPVEKHHPAHPAAHVIEELAQERPLPFPSHQVRNHRRSSLERTADEKQGESLTRRPGDGFYRRPGGYGARLGRLPADGVSSVLGGLANTDEQTHGCHLPA
jgi:hypothetical protein